MIGVGMQEDGQGSCIRDPWDTSGMDSLVNYGYRIYLLELEVCIKYLASCCYDGNCIELYLYGYL